MKTEPSDKHEELKALLAQSFRSEEADDVPSLPGDLRDRIRDQYGKDLAPAPTEERSESLFTRISRLPPGSTRVTRLRGSNELPL